MKKGIIITILVLFVIGGTALAISLTRPKKNTNNNASTSISVDQPSSSSTNSSDAAAASVITYNGSSFNPSSLTVTSGTVVTVKNSSSEAIQFDSDPHPQHTDNTELNIGVIKPGDSGTMTLSTKGTFGYHNHLNSSQKGTITVQ